MSGEGVGSENGKDWRSVIAQKLTYNKLLTNTTLN